MKDPATVWDMSADDDEIIQAISDLAEELTGSLDAFEIASGFQVCLRALSHHWDDLDGRLIVGERYEYHRSDFCVSWKERALAACTRCDNNELLPACTERGVRRRDPFLRTCHAGADEVIVPVWSQNVLVAVLFIGQFVARDGDAPAELPRLVGEARSRILGLARPLRYYLIDVLGRLERIKSNPRVGKRAMIENYVRESLADGPSLQGLSARLSLSTSRASHVVREATGESFQEVVERQRIGVATDLLSRTDATVAAVGIQVGFRDPGYFSRYFKLKTGLTPGEFRRGSARRVPV